MSKNYVVTDDNGNYLSDRFNYYENEHTWEEGLQSAALFEDMSQAKSEARRNGECTHFRVVPVKITLDEETSE